MGGDRGDLRLLKPALDRAGQQLEGVHGCPGASLQPAPEIDGAGARHHVPHAVGEDGVGEDRRGAGAVADGVARTLGGLADHLRARGSRPGP